MGCSHKKRRIAIAWSVPRKGETLVVQADHFTVFVCESCKAVRVDNYNDLCYSQGRFLGRVTQEKK